jgi:methionyl-tRNA formyltransferase
MAFKKIAVLTSEQSWFVPHALKLVNILKENGYNSNLFFKHGEIGSDYEVVFILSYFKLIESDFLNRHRHNIVVHGSDLPKGRGWAPIFWQILENKNEIPITLFEANENADDGDIYLKGVILFEGHELNAEIREKQAAKTIDLCLTFLNNYNKIRSIPQEGKPTFYRKRNPKDSELDINKSLKEQFDLLRIVNNKDFPAFFYHKGHKYILKISKEKTE